MKKALELLTVGMISTLLMGCPGNSGGGGNGNVNQFANESCTVLNNNFDMGSYSCTQLINGVQRSTQQVSFSTRQDFCYKITNQQFNMDYATGQAIAVNFRAQLSSQQCTAYPTNPTNPTNPTLPGMEGFKTFTCQLYARRGNAVYQGEAQQFYLPRNGGSVTLKANAMQMDKWKWIPYSRVVNLGTLTMRYIPAMGMSTTSMDQIKMSISGIDSTSVSVAGFAGAENRIEITPRDEEGGSTQILASCVSTDAMTRPQIISSDKYQCVGTEQYRGRTRPINYVNLMSDVVSSGISITNTVYVQADGAGGLVNFSQALNSYDDSSVDVRASMLSPTSVNIEKLGYSLKVKCQPK